MIQASKPSSLLVLVLLVGCSGTTEDSSTERAERDDPRATDEAEAQAAPAEGNTDTTAEGPGIPPGEQPDAIRVQHILIGFRDAAGFQGREAPVGAAGRSEAEAQELAEQLLARARRGEDFAALVVEHTDDQAPGIYGMTNAGVAEREGYYPREGMVSAFGDVGFSLEVGEIGMTRYDPASSKYGWHIIKRLE